MIIGLTGKKGAGKDTVGGIIKGYTGGELRAFADPLKKFVNEVFDIPLDVLYGTQAQKERERDINVKARKIKKYFHSPTLLLHKVTDPLGLDFRGGSVKGRCSTRRLMQQLGTEYFQSLDIEYWTKKMDNTPNSIVTDVRFRHEVNWVRSNGGVVVAIDRPSLEEEDTHLSERGVSGDYTIINDGSIEKLRASVKNLLIELGEMAC